MTVNKLYYIHDPMCSWCWGFRSAWLEIKAGLVDIDIPIELILGGLAPDSNESMPLATREYVKDNWLRIQQAIPGTAFNYDFWSVCEPRRSTYPACRAVIAATQQGKQYEEPMVLAIQQAYYLQAKNPSDDEVLYECAMAIGLDKARFMAEFHSDQTQQQLLQHVERYRLLAAKTGASGFPSLVLFVSEKYVVVPLDYNDPVRSLDFIRSQL
jgi:putative protein-disulfide isomerase